MKYLKEWEREWIKNKYTQVSSLKVIEQKNEKNEKKEREREREVNWLDMVDVSA